ncbi:hypothetical protein DFAR_2500010 [Desulfarculales bacterium]
MVMRRAIVIPRQADFYTRTSSEKQTEIMEETGCRSVANFLLCQGLLKVTETVRGFERRRVSGSDLLGAYALKIPPLTFEPHGLWLDIEDDLRCLVEKNGRHFMGSIHALEHAAIGMFPLLILCDRGGISLHTHCYFRINATKVL